MSRQYWMVILPLKAIEHMADRTSHGCQDKTVLTFKFSGMTVRKLKYENLTWPNTTNDTKSEVHIKLLWLFAVTIQLCTKTLGNSKWEFSYWGIQVKQTWIELKRKSKFNIDKVYKRLLKLLIANKFLNSFAN